jgi:AcrR family transcriptional regulator
VPRPVKTRPYRSTRRAQQAAATRQAVLRAAHQRFTAQGYAATTVAQVAQDAGVALDTVYAAVGRKPQLVLALVDEALAGHAPSEPGGRPTPSVERDYVQAVRAAPDARTMLGIYATAVAQRQAVAAPLVAVLRQAASTDSAAAEALAALTERRAANMRLLAADLRRTGELRDDLTDDQVAVLVWSTNSPEYYDALTSREMTPDDVARLLADVWTRTLLTR